MQIRYDASGIIRLVELPIALDQLGWTLTRVESGATHEPTLSVSLATPPPVDVPINLEIDVKVERVHQGPYNTRVVLGGLRSALVQKFGLKNSPNEELSFLASAIKAGEVPGLPFSKVQALPLGAKLAYFARLIRRLVVVFDEKDRTVLSIVDAIEEVARTKRVIRPAQMSRLATISDRRLRQSKEKRELNDKQKLPLIPQAVSRFWSACERLIKGESVVVIAMCEEYTSFTRNHMTGGTGMMYRDILLPPAISDLELLEALAQTEGWGERRLVDPDVLGALFLSGPYTTKYLEAARAGNQNLEIEVQVPDSASDKETLELVRELADMADDVHRAYGGQGLRVVGLEITDEARIPQEVTP